jgi:hypothetical protein
MMIFTNSAKGTSDKKVVCVTIARELVGSLWDIVYREMPKARAA